MANKEAKAPVIDALAEKLQRSSIAILTDYRGLSVAEITDLRRKLRAVNALITGMHEPEATHLAMLEALAGLSHIKLAYEEALRKGYLWHEFGDLHLILP